MDRDLSSARLWLRVGSNALGARAFHGREALSEPFEFTITAADRGLDPAALLGLPGVLGWRGEDGGERQVAGLIRAVETDGRDTALTLVPRLALLRQRRDSRVLRNLSLPEILRQLLEAHGYRREQITLDLSRGYPVRPYTLQANESDFDFLQRLLAGAGIFYWFDCAEGFGGEDGQERIHFSDHNAACPYLPSGVLHYRPDTGTHRSLGQALLPGFDQLCLDARAVAPPRGVHILSDPLPARPRSTRGGASRFAAAPAELAEAEAQTTLLRERALAQSVVLGAQGDVVGVSAGGVVSVEAARFDPAVSGDYLVIAAEHRLADPDDLTGAAPRGYRLSTRLIRRETAFRPPLPPRPKLPLLFPARIESGGRYAEPDALGRPRLRPDFDRGAHPHAGATPPLPQLSPYGGAPNPLAVGLHFPLRDGAKVLLTCLNQDPDRPLLVGYAPSAAQPGPVVSANRPQNRLRTPAGNELALDDSQGRETIELKTFDGHTALRLDADSDAPLARLACQFGPVQLMAKRAQRLIARENLTERVGAGRSQIVGHQSTTRTRQAEIHHQAATDALLRAGQGALIQSGEDTQWVAGQRLRIHAGRDVQVTVQGADGLIARIRNGDVHVQAAKDIRLQGQGGGDISFEQNGGGFTVKADGAVRLFGKRVTLKAQTEVTLNGSVEYTVPAARYSKPGESAD